jgi:hypothetical protein
MQQLTCLDRLASMAHVTARDKGGLDNGCYGNTVSPEHPDQRSFLPFSTPLVLRIMLGMRMRRRVGYLL